MSVVTVASTAALIQALKTAHSGDVIQLQPGEYSAVTLKGLKLTDVTIQSSDPSRPAVLTDLMVRDSSGLNFRNLEFAVDPNKPLYSFQVYGSSHVTFEGLNVHGTLDGNPVGDKDGLMIRNSTDVSVTKSEFHELHNGINFLDSSKVVIEGNKFHDIQTDGIRGGGTSEMKVLNNSFTDFFPAAGDHPDAIQFWTTNTTVAAHDILISGNVVTRGSGEAIQGIFLRDQVGTLPYKNVEISNNVVIGGMYNGIDVQGGTNLKITDNLVAGLPDQKSWIRVDDASGVLLQGNSSTAYIFNRVSDIANIENKTIPVPTDGGSALLSQWHSAEIGTMDAATAAPAAEMMPVKTIVGTAGDDRLSVVAGFDTTIDAGAGNDVLTGGIGHHTLIGGAGDDTYVINDASNVIVENANGGLDTVVASVDYVLGANLEALRLTGNAHVGTGNELNNRIIGTAGADILSGLGGNDLLQGGAGDDVLYGGDGDDDLRGEDGADHLFGGAGADKLYGGAGNDRLEGGDGNDWLEGGGGADILVGGAGADRFYFRPDDLGSIDTILDFSSAQGDKIGLSAIDANVFTSALDKFAFIGTQDFHGKAGELRYEVKDGMAWVYGDTNGDKIPDFTLCLANVKSLAASDFVL